jgi:hypothetical protein
MTEEPKQSLVEWAVTSILITASFYFWDAGMEMQRSQGGEGTTWTAFLERVCCETAFWGDDIIQDVAEVFLRYDANPLTSHYHHGESSVDIQLVSKGLGNIAGPQLQKLMDDETAYFRSRERYSRTSGPSQARGSRYTCQPILGLQR